MFLKTVYSLWFIFFESSPQIEGKFPWYFVQPLLIQLTFCTFKKLILNCRVITDHIRLILSPFVTFVACSTQFRRDRGTTKMPPYFFESIETVVVWQNIVSGEAGSESAFRTPRKVYEPACCVLRGSWDNRQSHISQGDCSSTVCLSSRLHYQKGNSCMCCSFVS